MAEYFPVNQVLFGYDRGHRLLASSIDIDADAGRTLRGATDMAFEGKTSSYFSVLPLPSMGMQAFVKTWPAASWSRPGSVWSHVLLVDFPTLGKLSNLVALHQAFRKPNDIQASAISTEAERYAHPIDMSPAIAHGVPAVDEALAKRLLQSLYSSSGTARAVVTDPVAAEQLLLAIHEQQWPRLRRTFAYRTRYRGSDSTWNVDLELLEKSSFSSLTEAKTESWAKILCRDLQSPDASFRRFVNRFGVETERGRLDMPILATAYSSLMAIPSAAAEALEEIAIEYPSPIQMAKLKREIVGPLSEAVFTANSGTSELERLGLAIRFAKSLDFVDLSVGVRLTSALRDSPEFLREILASVDIESLKPEQIDIVITGIVADFALHLLEDLALAQPEFGVLVAAKRPELLLLPNIWEGLDNELLARVFERSPLDLQDRIMSVLLRSSASAAISLLCAARPERWWRLLFQVAGEIDSARELIPIANSLRASLDRFGAASLGAPPRPLRTRNELILLLLSADLSAGLWRRTAATLWLRARGSQATSNRGSGLPQYALERLHAVVLVTATTTGDAAARRMAWQKSFAFLHESLKSESFDLEAWTQLNNALPAGPEWDRCKRLRRGAIAEIRREDWSPDAVAGLARGAGQFGNEIAFEVSDAKRRTKKKNWFEEIITKLFS